MGVGRNTRVRHKIDSGKHHRVNRKAVIEADNAVGPNATEAERTAAFKARGAMTTIRAGEAFSPTDREKAQNVDRLSRTTKYFLSPGIPGIHF